MASPMTKRATCAAVPEYLIPFYTVACRHCTSAACTSAAARTDTHTHTHTKHTLARPALAQVWALGVTLYECCARARPFEADNPGALAQAILAGAYPPLGSCSADLAGVIAACLALVRGCVGGWETARATVQSRGCEAGLPPALRWPGA